MIAMYLIVVGAGQIGMPLISLATEDANEVVVIERDEDIADAAVQAFDCRSFTPTRRPLTRSARRAPTMLTPSSRPPTATQPM